MIEKYVYKLSIFNLANKPTPTFKSSVLYISNHCINQRNHAHPHYFQKSQISLTIEHKTKNKDYQWREDEVTKLWRTWMTRTLTKTRKNGGNSLRGRTTPSSSFSGEMALARARGGRRRQFIVGALVPASGSSRH